MKIKSNMTTKPLGFAYCIDINANNFGHGEYFTPRHSECKRCFCNNGRAENCVIMQCERPSCQGFERIPGKCCEYKCPESLLLTEKSMSAVIASLSVLTIVLVVVIRTLWKKDRKTGLSSENFHKVSWSQQDFEYDSAINKNSILNNTRNGHKPFEMVKDQQLPMHQQDIWKSKKLAKYDNLHIVCKDETNLLLGEHRYATHLTEVSKNVSLANQSNLIHLSGLSEMSMIKMKPII